MISIVCILSQIINEHISIAIKCHIKAFQRKWWSAVEKTRKEQVVMQNYGHHLDRNHPQENFKDRRPYGEKKLSYGLSPVYTS